MTAVPFEHVAVAEIGDRPADRVGERRPARNDDLARVIVRLRNLPFHDDRRSAVVVAEQVGRSDDLWQGLEQLPALALEAIAGSRT